MLSFANPTLPEFSDDLPIAPAVGALQGPHGKPNTFSSYTTRRDTAEAAVEALLYPPSAPSRALRPEPDWAGVHRELRRKGVTLDLLWQEY